MTSTSQAGPGPISQQYAAAATVPLIKSPSLWLPKPVELPELHPLPDDITAYFVYPFNLEEHVLSLRPSPHEAISQRRARNAETLHRREVEEEQRERDALKRIAPGYNPSSLLVPTAQNSHPQYPQPTTTAQTLSPTNSNPNQQPQPQQESYAASQSTDPMDALVAQLEEMEAKR